MKIEDAFQNLKHACDSGRLAQAYIIIGSPREEGRQLTEKILELVFCLDRRKPCESCRGCREVKAHTHPDVLWVEPQMKSRKISVGQIRDLQKQIFQTSYAGGWKACVLVGADRIGDQAANAFLKTLEEPPARCVFFLLTDSPQFLLSTVVSRCQSINVAAGRLNLPAEWRKEIVNVLGCSNTMQSGKRSVVASFGAGERLCRFLEGIKKDIEKEETDLAEQSQLEEDDDTLDARVSSRYRESRAAIMHAILLWHRDILMLVSGMDKDLVFRKDAFDCMAEKARTLSARAALRNVQIVEEMNRQLERNLPEGTVMSFGFSSLN